MSHELQVVNSNYLDSIGLQKLESIWISGDELLFLLTEDEWNSYKRSGLEYRFAMRFLCERYGFVVARIENQIQIGTRYFYPLICSVSRLKKSANLK